MAGKSRAPCAEPSAPDTGNLVSFFGNNIINTYKYRLLDLFSFFHPDNKGVLLLVS